MDNNINEGLLLDNRTTIGDCVSSTVQKAKNTYNMAKNAVNGVKNTYNKIKNFTTGNADTPDIHKSRQEIIKGGAEKNALKKQYADLYKNKDKFAKGSPQQINHAAKLNKVKKDYTKAVTNQMDLVKKHRDTFDHNCLNFQNSLDSFDKLLMEIDTTIAGMCVTPNDVAGKEQPAKKKKKEVIEESSDSYSKDKRKDSEHKGCYKFSYKKNGPLQSLIITGEVNG